MWYGECYTSKPGINVHVRTLGDELGQNKKDPKDAVMIEKAWGRKKTKNGDYLNARDGDHSMVPFECNLCIFRKLRKKDPLARDPQDDLLLACVRCMNLDAFGAGFVTLCIEARTS
jgi:hypothetical protein